MMGKTHATVKVGWTIVAALAVGAVAAQSAVAYDGPPDTRDAVAAAAAAIAAQGFQGAPDTRDAVAAARRAVAEKAAADQGFMGAPDTRDAVVAARRAIAAGTSSGMFPPRIATSARNVREAAPASAGGFDWGDFGIGVGVALGSILLLTAVVLVAWSSHHRRREAGRPALT